MDDVCEAHDEAASRQMTTRALHDDHRRLHQSRAGVPAPRHAGAGRRSRWSFAGTSPNGSRAASRPGRRVATARRSAGPRGVVSLRAVPLMSASFVPARRREDRRHRADPRVDRCRSAASRSVASPDPVWPFLLFVGDARGGAVLARGLSRSSRRRGYGQTLGKRLMGLRVVRESGARDQHRASGRPTTADVPADLLD